MNHSAHRTVLISGASIAGPTLAYWLDRYGVEVTVVEKASSLRGGGYAIDIRGTARGVVDRMGLLPRLREAHVDTRRITFVAADGTTVGSQSPVELLGSDTEDLEVRRGDLASALYDATRDSVEYRFDDSIATLSDHGDLGDGVEVTFASGLRRTYDLVVGADGLHSNIRRLVFGPEEPFHRYLGYAFAGFTLDNDLGLEHEGVIWNAPGRAGVLYAHEPTDRVYGFLAFAEDEPPFAAFRDPEAQRDFVAARFPEHVWHLPRLVAAIREADDLFFDIVSQIHLPTWSRGRVAFAGDAAHATSFLSGQGSSVALVGAYILAGELAVHDEFATALAEYERKTRGFAERNQALAAWGGGIVTPRSEETIDQRNAALREPAGREADRGAVYNSLTLPDYGTLTPRGA